VYICSSEEKYRLLSERKYYFVYVTTQRYGICFMNLQIFLILLLLDKVGTALVQIWIGLLTQDILALQSEIHIDGQKEHIKPVKVDFISYSETW
jgi:hypothetical protein